MLNTILLTARIVFLILIAVLLLQVWRKFKSIPEDERIGEERAKYIDTRLKILALCTIAEAALSIAHRLLQFTWNNA